MDVGMDFAAAVNRIVEQMVRHIERDLARGRQQKHTKRPKAAASGRGGSFMAPAKARRSAGKRSGRRCRQCRSVKHDLRNCPEKGARNGKR